ncbi:MAG: HD domain-containing protein [Treponema sp.]|nr:HD domain-containing protein [Treponema sp.]
MNAAELDEKLLPLISSGSIIRIAERILLNFNREVLFHAERTAYLAMKIGQNHQLPEKCSLNNLVLLALFHTIGFYRQDFTFVPNSNPYETAIDYFSPRKEIESKYVFGCYYLEFLTPLHKDALALESFNQPFNKDLKKYIYQEEYRSIITLCARISNFIHKNPDLLLPEDLNMLAPGQLDPEYIEIFNKINEDDKLVIAIQEETYKNELMDFLDNIEYKGKDYKMLLKLVIHLLDFKSTVTMSHSINTSCYALSIGMRAGLSIEELSELYISAVLHDIGKSATPQRILEFPGRLSPEEMGIMKHHVKHSKRILMDLVPQNIIDNVFRHHEKLDGSGYPMHLKGDVLTKIQRILTVADITSALSDSRSYKCEYSKEDVLSIVAQMTINNELDKDITTILSNNYDQIKAELSDLQNLLKVDFSNVINKYNDYLLNNASETLNKTVIDSSDTAELEEIEDLEEIDD